MEKEFSRDKIITELDLTEYASIPPELSEWLTNDEPIPEELQKVLDHLTPQSTVKDVIYAVKSFLFSKPPEEHSYAEDFEDARFTPLAKMIQRKLNSCGAVAHMCGSALRSRGVPVKYVHGNLERQLADKDARHAWLEVYNPSDKTWQEVDPSAKDAIPHDDRMSKKRYHNWQEMREDFEKGEY